MKDSEQRSPRGRLIWGGFCLTAWLRLLARNRFAVEPDLHWATSCRVVNRSWLGS